MESYKILGIDENASMEEVRQAYENKVNEIKKEIINEKRAKAFIEVFDNAYEEIKVEKEKIQSQETTVINIKKINSEQNSKNDISTNKFEEDEETFKNNKIKKKPSSIKSSRNNYNKSIKSSNKDKKDNLKRRNNNKKKELKKEENSSIGTLIQFILKVLALPIIVILTIVIFLCKLINLISWIASKIIIVAAIAGASIHGYQVYIGQPMYYEIFIGCAIAFLVALLLPSILKIVPSLLEKINSKLKNFVF